MFHDYLDDTADDENGREMNNNNKKECKKEYNLPGLHKTMLTFYSPFDEHTVNAGNAVALAQD